MKFSDKEYQQVMQMRNGGNSQNNNNYPNNNYRSNEQKKKKSGAGYKLAVSKSTGEQKPCTWGWKANKFTGITKFFCAPCKHTKTVTSPSSGKIWHCGVACTITNATLGTSTFHFGMMEASTGKVIIDKLGIVINPKANNGGVVATIGGGKRK